MNKFDSLRTLEQVRAIVIGMSYENTCVSTFVLTLFFCIRWLSYTCMCRCLFQLNGSHLVPKLTNNILVLTSIDQWQASLKKKQEGWNFLQNLKNGLMQSHAFLVQYLYNSIHFYDFKWVLPVFSLQKMKFGGWMVLNKDQVHRRTVQLFNM